MNSKTIAVAGAGGLIARATIPLLKDSGWRVIRLVRRPALRPDERTWQPDRPLADHVLEGCRAVLNLSGHSIADWPWTTATRRLILESRVRSTGNLAHAAGRHRVETFLNGSAIGYYGSRGDVPLEENHPAGTGFLAEVCGAWERALSPLDGSPTRVVKLRTGIVLSLAGGSLPGQWKAWKLGLGSILGDGTQWIPWIHLQDQARAIVHLLESPGFEGPVNLCTPYPVRQREFSDVLDATLQAKTRLRVPASLLRLALGGFADQLLLASQNARPHALMESGFEWRFPRLGEALREIRSESAQ